MKRERRRAFIFIHLFLLVQLALPLWYYAGRLDKNDERFAWRMFSPTRMLTCQREFYVGDDPRPISNLKEFHEAWDTIAKRGRRHVVEAMALSLCDREGIDKVRVLLQCKRIDGKIQSVSAGKWNVCEVGGL